MANLLAVRFNTLGNTISRHRARIWHVLVYCLIALAIVFGITVLVVRYWLLPNIENYRVNVAQAASKAAGVRIEIGSIAASWDSINPHLRLNKVQVFDAAGRPALALDRVDNTVSWLSLAFFELRLRSLEINQPNLNIRRDVAGVIYIAGIALNQKDTNEGGLSDWLLRQRKITIRDATVVWEDEMRGAPPLRLEGLNFRLENRGRRHRFGLQAIPPAAIASPIDLRGNLIGRSVKDFERWHGTLFAQFDYTDLIAWRTWINYPLHISQGAGALRLWLNFDGTHPNDVLADVRLLNVKTRLGKDIPELDLKNLEGRIGWKKREDGFEFLTEKLALETQGGLTLRPSDFSLQLANADPKSHKGQIRVNSLDLEPLVSLANHLPLEKSLRDKLSSYSPRGSISDFTLKWQGDAAMPQQHYTVKGRFQNLGILANDHLPGFTGISGHIDASEKSGTLTLDTAKARIDLAGIFLEPIHLDTLTGQLHWTTDEQFHLKLNNIAFSNTHLAGTAFGEYQTLKEGPGLIDLSGNLSRGDGRQVATYMPLKLSQHTRDWVAKAIQAGASDDVRFRLKGDLRDFPFVDSKKGIFQIAIKAKGVTLNYVEGWPKVENISGEVVFRGRQMEIRSEQGNIYGAKLSKVHVMIPNLGLGDELLQITGQAAGPTTDFLTFIEHSSVASLVDGFAEGVHANGNGKLDLRLDIPLHHRQDTKVAGAYQFIDNQLVVAPEIPPLEHVNGKLEFTQAGIKVQNANAQLLGGPAIINVVSRPEGVRVAVHGKSNVAELRKVIASPVAQHLSGITEWRGQLSLRKKQVDMVLDSNLVGLVSDLPPPFTKTAAEVIPLRVERKITGPQQDAVSLSYGKIVSAQLLRHQEGGVSRIDRGNIVLGGGAEMPDRPGLWVKGSLASLNVDLWRALLTNPVTSAVPAVGPPPINGGIDMKVGALDVFGKRINDLKVNAISQTGTWQINLTSKEMNGEALWKPEGRGKVTARLHNFIMPGDVIEKPLVAVKKVQENDWPAVDIIADNFQIKEKKLGRFEFIAFPDGRDWRIEKLHLNNPEGSIQGEGVWQSWLTQPQTKMNVTLEVSDIGKYLSRFGYPEGVKRGSGKIDGQLTWAGSPQDFDYPTLSGNMLVEASKGQFSKIEPGLGKLLGVLSLQSLPRRMSLDFRDIFSDGLAFDEIAGSVKIDRGVMSTSNFRIQGPAARILMTGETDLAAETQKLNVKVTPKFGDGFSMATALFASPVVGIASFLIQKALKDPLDKLISYEYNVTGSWAEPTVTKVKAPPPVNAEQQP